MGEKTGGEEGAKKGERAKSSAKGFILFILLRLHSNLTKSHFSHLLEHPGSKHR